MKRTICRLILALPLAFVLLLPVKARLQNLGAAEANTALQGTRLTYYPRPNFNQCQADCANNANCKGFTWIQAGTYNASDAAMCYLMSAVTGKNSARGHYSAVKGTTGGSPGGTYLGCYRDPNNPFDLDGYLVRSRTNTPQRCIETCRQKGFKYAGVQYGESCLCGNSYGKYGQANNCNYKCTGDPGQICGGHNANSVYATGAGGGTGGGGGGGGGATISAYKLEGFWQFHQQCKGPWELLIGIKPTSDTTFEGGFENGNGTIKDGRISGNQITFTRVVYEPLNQVQKHWGTLVNEGGRLKIINGGWSGYYQENCNEAKTWRAEKR